MNPLTPKDSFHIPELYVPASLPFHPPPFCFPLPCLSLLGSASCPGTCCVDLALAGLELKAIILPQPLECLDYNCAPPSPAQGTLYFSAVLFLVFLLISYAYIVCGCAHTTACS